MRPAVAVARGGARITDGGRALSLAVSRSNSLRATVPANIVQKLELEQGDHLKWDMDKIGGEWIAVIKEKE